MAQQQKESMDKYTFDVQGHRGARGLAPENSIPAFKKALQLKVNTLELDVVISKDEQVVISHEAWMNPQICLTPESKIIDSANEKKHHIYQMDYEQVKKYDCGSKSNSTFPNQNNQPTIKPKLSELIKLVQSHNAQHKKPVHLNIEIKSSPQGDGINHPKPKKFLDLVVHVLDEYNVSTNNYNLQSFDIRILKMIHKHYPSIRTAALVEEADLSTYLKKLGFTPDIFSPYYSLVDHELIKNAHQKGMKVIPWTVNTKKEMQDLLKIGVDGIITDYPDIAVKLIK